MAFSLASIGGHSNWEPPNGDWILQAQAAASQPALLSTGNTRSSSSRSGQRPPSGNRASQGELKPVDAPAQSLPSEVPFPRAPRPLLLERSRLPIAGNSGMAWRRPNAQPSSPSKVAGAIASGKVHTNISPHRQRTSDDVLTTESDRALAASTAARLVEMEKFSQYQAAKLARQSQELDMLRAELAMRRGKDDDRREIHALRKERDRYLRQVEDMTKFLSDYGLTWVGDDAGDEDLESYEHEEERCKDDNSGSGVERSGQLAEKLGRPSSTEGVSLDIHLIQERVQSLNAMVQKESARIVSSRIAGAVHARLVANDTPEIPITFFQDGVKLGTHDFLAYNAAPAQQLIQDVLDGYFPFALKDDHPDGVDMKVIDRTCFSFSDWLQRHASGDPNLTDGGDRLLPTGGHILGARQRPGMQINSQESGRAPSCSSRTISAPAARGTSEVSLLEAGRDPAHPIARLQVKLEDGERVVFQMEPFHSIGDLEDALDSWRAEHAFKDCSADGRRFQLRTAFPPKAYTDRQQTLQEANLAPSATLFLGVADGCGT